MHSAWSFPNIKYRLYAVPCRWKGMIPDVLVLCVVTMFGMNVVQRVWHVVQHSPESALRGIYQRTGLLLNVIILCLQALCEPLTKAPIRLATCVKCSYAALLMLQIASVKSADWMHLQAAKVCQVQSAKCCGSDAVSAASTAFYTCVHQACPHQLHVDLHCLMQAVLHAAVGASSNTA